MSLTAEQRARIQEKREMRHGHKTAPWFQVEKASPTVLVIETSGKQREVPKAPFLDKK